METGALPCHGRKAFGADASQSAGWHSARLALRPEEFAVRLWAQSTASFIKIRLTVLLIIFKTVQLRTVAHYEGHMITNSKYTVRGCPSGWSARTDQLRHDTAFQMHLHHPATIWRSVERTECCRRSS